MKLLTIFGNPIKHSISPLIHNYCAKELGDEICYTRYLLENENELVDKFLELGLAGANVTVPFKEAAYRLSHEVRGIAKKTGAVNTLVYEKGRVIGYNTDADGFLMSIKEFDGIKKVLLLGAGGTAKAISLILSKNGYDVEILNRSKNRLKPFEDVGFATFSWEEFEMKEYDLIINSTSAGLSDESLPFEESKLSTLVKNSKACVDVIYNKTTPFLAMAKMENKAYKDGSDMLLFQAVLAYQNFVNPDRSLQEIERYMREAFLLL